MNKLLKSQIVEYSEENKHLAEQFASAQCTKCQSDTFTVVMNENEGVAVRICTSCDREHGIGDSSELIDEVDEVYPIECSCEENEFKIMAGVAITKSGDKARWFYLGCECVSCGLSGVYGDWRSEAKSYQKLLDRV